MDDAAGLAVDDIIVFDNPNGQGLKRIVAVNVRRDGNAELVTEDASLADVIENGVLRSTLVLSDMDAVAADRDGRGDGAVYVDPDGAFQLSSSRGLRDGEGREDVGDVPALGAGEVDFDYGLKLAYDVGFEPSLDTEARFEWLSLKYCRIVATGALSLDVSAQFELTGELDHNPKRKLFGVSHLFIYGLVWQEVGIDVYAELEVTAAGALNVEAVYSAVKTVQVGVVYDDGAWSTVTSDGFKQNVEFSIEAKGTLLARVSVYPKLWTRFYSALAADMFVQPALGLDSTVRFAPEPVEMTRVDVDFTVDAYLSAGLRILDR